MNKEQLKEMFGIVFEIMGSDELASSVATMYAKLVRNLEAEGFSREKAVTVASRMRFNNK